MQLRFTHVDLMHIRDEISDAKKGNHKRIRTIYSRQKNIPDLDEVTLSHLKADSVLHENINAYADKRNIIDLYVDSYNLLVFPIDPFFLDIEMNLPILYLKNQVNPTGAADDRAEALKKLQDFEAILKMYVNQSSFPDSMRDRIALLRGCRKYINDLETYLDTINHEVISLENASKIIESKLDFYNTAFQVPDE